MNIMITLLIVTCNISVLNCVLYNDKINYRHKDFYEKNRMSEKKYSPSSYALHNDNYEEFNEMNNDNNQMDIADEDVDKNRVKSRTKEYDDYDEYKSKRDIDENKNSIIANDGGPNDDDMNEDHTDEDEDDDNYSLFTTYPNGTTHTNLTEEQFKAHIIKFIRPHAGTFILMIIHAIVFIIGLIGNVLVCVAVYKNHTMRTVTNYFIVNLALADFLVILFCLPPTVIWDITLTWFFGLTMCKIVLYLQNVSVVVSVLTLTFISIDRWYAICFPLKFKSTTGRAKTAIAMIWFVALLTDIPELVYLQTTQSNLPYKTIYFTQCTATWSAETEFKYNICRFIFLYVTPLSFMTVTYFHIIRVLWKSGNGKQHAVDVGGNRQMYTFTIVTNTSTRGQLRSRKKAAKMLVAVVIMFALCYFPVHLLSIFRTVYHMENSDVNRAFALLSHWLCYANSAVNPIIYNFMSGKFRKEFRRAFKCCSSSNTNSLHELNSMYYKNIGRDSGLGSTTPSRMSRSSKRQQVEIRRNDTIVDDLGN